MSNCPDNPVQGEVKAGHFCVLRSGSELSRLVLVIQLVSNNGAVVMIVTNETELATHNDVLVRRNDSGLAYEVLVETDLVATVFRSQLDAPIGQLSERLSGLLSLYPDLSQFIPEATGIHMPGPWDTRWEWKRSELRNLQRLAAARFAKVVCR